LSNLKENRKDEEAPFVFLATYMPRLSAEARARHLDGGDVEPWLYRGPAISLIGQQRWLDKHRCW
jgi:hypothetical protein